MKIILFNRWKVKGNPGRPCFRMLLGLGLAGVLAGAAAVQAEDWAQWRGPNRDGISQEKGWLKNWPQVARLLLTRLQREAAADPTHQALRQLLADLSRLPGVAGVAAQWPNHEWLSPMPPPIFPLEFDLGADTLNVFSMVSTFGTALDITAEELRVETFFPADDFSRDFFRILAGTGS